MVALLAVLAFLGLVGTARADETFDVGPNPVLNVQLVQGPLTVRTWDRRQIAIVTQGRLAVRHLPAAVVDPRLHRQMTIWSQSVEGARGEVRLPQETFVLPRLAGASHDAVTARGSGATTIMIPRGTALVVAHLKDGRFHLQDYAGVFVAHVRAGGLRLDHVGGIGFAEVLHGPVIATQSNFTRLRVRTAFGNMFFRGCTAHQIEATSTYGSIVYDNGKFKPGLAHFSSEHGNVAVGVRSNDRVQIGAQAASGRVFSNLHGAATLRGASMFQAAPAGVRAPPIVTTATKSGSIYLYTGSIRSNPAVRAQLLLDRSLPRLHRPPNAAPNSKAAHPPPHRPPPPQAGDKHSGKPPAPFDGLRATKGASV